MRRKQELYDQDDSENYQIKLVKEKVQIRRSEREVTFNRKRTNFIPTQHLLKQKEKKEKESKQQQELNSSSTESKSEKHQQPGSPFVIDQRYSEEIKKASSSEFTIDSLNQLVVQVTSQMTHDIIFGAIGLRKLLICNSQNTKQIIDAGLLDVFFQLLNYQESPQVQLEITWCIANIAAGTNDQCRMLVNKGIIPILVDLLKKRQLGIMEQAIWAVGNIISDSSQFRDQLLDAGAGEALIQIILNENCGDNLLQECCWCIMNLCRGNPLPEYQKIKNLLRILCSMLSNGSINNYEVFIDSCWAISYHYTIEQQRFKTLIEFNILEKLIPLALATEDHHIIYPILRIIGQLTAGDDVDYLFELRALDLLSITLLSSRKSMRRESAWILSNLAASGQSKHVNIILKDDRIIKRIMQLFENDSEDVRREVGFIFKNICFGAKSIELDQVYAQIDITFCYLRLLQSLDQEIVYDALGSLAVILRYGQQKMNSRGSEVNLIAEGLLKNGGIEIIQNLQDHPSQRVYLKCSEILQNFFNVQACDIEKLKFRKKVLDIINTKKLQNGNEVP